MLSLNLFQQSAINWPLVVALLFGLMACFAGFIYQESQAPEPIIRLAVFRNLDIAFLQIASIAINFAGFTVLLLFPFHLAGKTGLSLAAAGGVLATSSLRMAIAGLVGTWPVSKVGPTQLTLVSPFLSFVGA